jgi:CO/xanthine dehydrogenase Mo-binding subunit
VSASRQIPPIRARWAITQLPDLGSRLPQSPVEGGSWIAASVSNGIVTTSDAIREELLRLAKQIPNSPLADATVENVTLSDGNVVSKHDASWAVSIAEAMRLGGVDRIDEERSTTFDDDGSQAHNTHSAPTLTPAFGICFLTRHLWAARKSLALRVRGSRQFSPVYGSDDWASEGGGG